LHDNLLLSRGFFAPQRVKSSHNGLFGYPRPPLTFTDTVLAIMVLLSFI
jgi:hypothetical protein